MTDSTATRPQTTDYLPYYERYVSLVPEGSILDTLAGQLDSTLALLRSVSEERALYRYAPDKWSIKELVGHVIDGERIFAYRALRFSRNDQTHLPGFEQDDYIRNASFDQCKLSDLVDEFEHVRRGNLLMFRQLTDAAWERRGVASEAEVSVRALAFIMAGHELHHMNVLKNKYLS
ncbi:MAG TPA: DinB family protein [Pyrinomonadaceae bacterium]|nr:DinB family protein [Pyrinomonadaceae bacterium]